MVCALGKWYEFALIHVLQSEAGELPLFFSGFQRDLGQFLLLVHMAQKGLGLEQAHLDCQCRHHSRIRRHAHRQARTEVGQEGSESFHTGSCGTIIRGSPHGVGHGKCTREHQSYHGHRLSPRRICYTLLVEHGVVGCDWRLGVRMAAE